MSLKIEGIVAWLKGWFYDKDEIEEYVENYFTANEYEHPSTHPATMIIDDQEYTNIDVNSNSDQQTINSAIDSSFTKYRNIRMSIINNDDSMENQYSFNMHIDQKYEVQVTITDINGNPVVGEETTLTAVAGKGYFEDTNNPTSIDLITNDNGQCSIQYVASKWGFICIRCENTRIFGLVTGWKKVATIDPQSNIIQSTKIEIYSDGKLARLQYAPGSISSSATNSPLGKTYVCYLNGDNIRPKTYFIGDATPFSSNFTKCWVRKQENANYFHIDSWSGSSGDVTVNANILYELDVPQW